MPVLGDESLAYRIYQTSSIGSARASWEVYAIRIREGDLLISVNGYGLAGSLGFEEVFALSTITVERPRRALPIPMPTRTPVPSPIAEATPPPVPTLGAAVLPVASYRAYRSAVGGTVFVVGEAMNRGGSPAARVQIAVSLLDERGNVLATANVNAAHLAVVPPGGRYPFRMMVDRVPRDWSEVRIQIQGLDAAGEPARYTALQAEALTQVQPALSGDGFGLAGDVANTGQAAAHGVRVVGVAYDSQGRVLDVAVTLAKLDLIEPGHKAPFALIWGGVLTNAPYRYEIFLEGQPG
jgi:hypothetical protein